MQGWVKLHRKIIDWEWYTDSGTLHLYLHLLFKANFEPKKWQGITINRGQFITSIDKLAAELPLSVRQIRTRLDKLKSTNELTIKTTSKYSIITITKYEEYQVDDKPKGKRLTNEGQTNDKPLTTTKNDKNLKNEKESVYPDWLDQKVWQEFKEYRKGKGNALNQLAETKSINALKKLIDEGYTQAEVIDNIIVSNWSGVYPPSKNNKPTQQPAGKKHLVNIMDTL